MRFISDAHSDIIGILFGILVSIASILIILQCCGIIQLKCKCS